MPALPTISPNQGQYDRIVASFVGDTAAEKVVAYKVWLTNALIDHVELTESRKLDDAANADKLAKLKALAESLPPRAV